MAAVSKMTPVNGCYEVKCSQCSKRTWAGCGLHQAKVMEKIPEEERCKCARG